MEGKTLLCADSQSLRNPVDLGLEGENLHAQPWLLVASTACQARNELDSGGLREAWVLSSDDMEGINLAAALARDSRACEVSLISFGASGSVSSRANAAGIGLIRGQNEFVQRYARQKRRYLDEKRAQEAAQARDVLQRQSAVPRRSWHPLGEGLASEELVLEEPPANPSGGLLTPLPPAALGLSSRAQAASVANYERDVAEHECTVISVVGGAGGVGKSTLAVACATQLQQRGHRTLLLDADLQFGDMAYLLGVEATLDVTELMASPERIAQIEPKNGLPALIAAPARLEESEAAIGRLSDLIAYLRGHFDVLVINTGAFWSEQHAQIIEASDTTLFVVDQRPSAVRACSHALSLCARCGIATQSFVFVLNFCSRNALLTSIDVSCALKGATVKEVRDGGRDVSELLGAGLPLELMSSKGPFAESVRRLCDEVVPEGIQGEAPPDHLRRFKPKRVVGSFRRRRAACL